MLTVISGGQTGKRARWNAWRLTLMFKQVGVDMAALYAAEAAGIPYTGWVPLHFTNETGEYGIPERFRKSLKETSTTASSERTEKNIKDSNGILTLLMEEDEADEGVEGLLKKSPGTLHGIEFAKKLGKNENQLLFVNLAKEDLTSEKNRVAQWLIKDKVERCAIGGPRESESKGIEIKAFEFLKSVFEDYKREIKLHLKR